LFFTACRACGIVTPINPLYTDHEVVHQLKDAGARFLIAAPQFIDKARAAAHEANIEELFVFGEAEGATAFADLIERDAKYPRSKSTRTKIS